jgi:hypothetical protein
MLYIRIDHDIFTNDAVSGPIARLLSRWLPGVDRDVQARAMSAQYWWIEVDDNSGIAEREISFDAMDTPIVIGPVANGFRGFWVDSFAAFADPQKWERVPEEEFVAVWNTFLSAHSERKSDGAA